MAAISSNKAKKVKDKTEHGASPLLFNGLSFVEVQQGIFFQLFDIYILEIYVNLTINVHACLCINVIVVYY